MFLTALLSDNSQGTSVQEALESIELLSGTLRIGRMERRNLIVDGKS